MPIIVTKNNEISKGIEQYFKDNDIDIKDIRNLKLLLQRNNDLLEGGLRSNNVTGFRNTYVINSSDSLDDTYPLDVHFNIENEMTKIVSIKLSFWIKPFRAYETAAESGGAVSSASGGGEAPTTSSGGASTPTSSSGGGQTSSVSSAVGQYWLPSAWESVTNVGDENLEGLLISGGSVEVDVPTSTHTHTVANHTHRVTIAAHTHTVTIAAHTHTGGAHTHAITFGIYEEDNSPTIGFQISKDNGETFGSVLGTYTNNIASLELKDYIASSGGYIIRFTSTARARLAVQLTCKLDITAR